MIKVPEIEALHARETSQKGNPQRRYHTWGRGRSYYRRKTIRIANTKAAVLGTLFVFATTLAPFVGSDQRNYLVIMLAALAGPLLMAFRFPLTKDAPWVGAAVFYLLTVTLAVGQPADFTTVGYTVMFALSYILFCAALSTGRIARDEVMSFLKWLIYAYGLVSLLQMISSLLGLPVPNLILSKGLWSYNSLAVEPSHAGRALATTMLAYLILSRNGPRKLGALKFIRQEKAVVGMFAVSIFLTGSALALVAAPVALILAFRARWIPVFSGIAIAAWPLLYMVDSPTLRRALGFLLALPSMEVESLLEADQSGALRLIPFLIYLEKVQFNQLSAWTGQGLGAIGTYVRNELIGAGDLVAAGFIPGYLISFGIVGTALFLFATVGRLLSWTTLTFALLWIALFTTSAWNTQLFWYGLMLLKTIHYFSIQKRLPHTTKGFGKNVMLTAEREHR